EGTTAARDGGAVRQAPRHDRHTPVGSNRSAVPHIRFATAIAVRSVDLGCPGTNTPKEHLAIGSIAVADEVAWSPVPSAGLDRLPRDPFRSRMGCGPYPQNPTPVMP